MGVAESTGYDALAIKMSENALHGYWPRRRAINVWMDLALSVEYALVGGSDLMVV